MLISSCSVDPTSGFEHLYQVDVFAGVVDRQVQHHIGTQEEKHPKDYMGLRKVTYNIPPVAADASLLLSTNR